MSTTSAWAKRIQDASRAAQSTALEYDELLRQTFQKFAEAMDRTLGSDYSVLSITTEDKEVFAPGNLLHRSNQDFARLLLDKVRPVSWTEGDTVVDRVALGFLPAGQGKLFRAIWLSAEVSEDGLKLFFGGDKHSASIAEDAWLHPDAQKASEERLARLVIAGLTALVSAIESVETRRHLALSRYRTLGTIELPALSTPSQRVTSPLAATQVWFDKE